MILRIGKSVRKSEPIIGDILVGVSTPNMAKLPLNGPTDLPLLQLCAQCQLISRYSPRRIPSCERGRKAVLPARAVVGLQVADGVLDAGQYVLQHRLHGVDSFAVAVRLVEDAAFAFAADPA